MNGISVRFVSGQYALMKWSGNFQKYVLVNNCNENRNLSWYVQLLSYIRRSANRVLNCSKHNSRIAGKSMRAI